MIGFSGLVDTMSDVGVVGVDHDPSCRQGSTSGFSLYRLYPKNCCGPIPFDTYKTGCSAGNANSLERPPTPGPMQNYESEQRKFARNEFINNFDERIKHPGRDVSCPGLDRLSRTSVA